MRNLEKVANASKLTNWPNEHPVQLLPNGAIFPHGLQRACFSEREVAFVADDDVVLQRDPQDFSGFAGSAGQPLVSRRWVGFAAGVVVHEDDAMCRRHDRNAKDLAGVGDGFVDGPDGHQIVAADAKPSVQNQHDGLLAVSVK